MRERKYKAWDRDTSSWCAHVDYQGSTNTFVGYSIYGSVCINIDVVEYTGLKDKNGVEIYEGDLIVIHKGGTIGTVEYLTEITWDSGGSLHPGFYCHEWIDEGDPAYYYGFDDCEVIGNIYENPELLGANS